MVAAVVGGGIESQGGERRGFWKRGDAIRSDPERRTLQSAKRQLWEGSPFSLSLSSSRAVSLNRLVVMIVPP